MQQVQRACMAYAKDHFVPKVCVSSQTTELSELSKLSELSFLDIPTVPANVKELCLQLHADIGEENGAKFVNILRQLVLTETPAKAAAEVVDSDICCWHTKLTYIEDILGYGIVARIGTGRAPELSTDGQFISETAYKEGLRTFPTKVTFQYFLPAWINKTHSGKENWLSTLRASIFTIGKAIGCKLEQDAFLTIFPELINRMIVAMMDQSSDYRASETLFQCILNLWRTFFHVVETMPGLRPVVVQKIDAFVHQEAARRKTITPNIGHTLVISSTLTSDKLNWSAFMTSFSDESFLRFVYWWQKKYVPITEAATFECSMIGCKNILFQTMFKGIVLQSDIQKTSKEVDDSNCKLSDRLQVLLDKWKDASTNLQSWNVYVSTMCEYGLPETLRNRILGNTTLYIHEVIKKADALEGYHFRISGGGSGRGNAGGGRGRR